MEYFESIIDFVFLLLAELLIKDMKLMKMENGLPCASVIRCWVSVLTNWPKRKTYQPMLKVIQKLMSTTTLETIDK